MRKRIFTLVFFAVLFLATNHASGQLTPVKIGHNAFTDETVFYLGRDVGIFKKHGIHLELIYIPGGSLSVQALDRQQFGHVAGRRHAARLRGLERRGSQIYRRPQQPHALRAGRSRWHQFPEQLRGKKIGISRFGSNTDFVVKLAATQMGLNPKRDVQIMQVGGPDARVVALKTGVVDATVLTPELVLLGRKLGYHTLLFDLVEKEHRVLADRRRRQDRLSKIAE